MFELSKSVLAQVSFDSSLFEKELRKFISWLENDNAQVESLHNWCLDNYGHVYKDLISKGFSKQ